MPLGIFSTYFERGSSPPPPPPPLSGGSGLKMFSPCAPCCSGSDFACEMDDPEYFGDIAIINGGGIFPLKYSGLNNLGYHCWRGVVQFTHGLAGYFRIHQPDGAAYTIESGSLSSLYNIMSYRPSYYPPQVYPNTVACTSGNALPQFSILNGTVLTSEEWRGEFGNFRSACGLEAIISSLEDPNRCDWTSQSFYMCSKIDFVECEINFPNVEYEYYRIPPGVGQSHSQWNYRMRYNSVDEFKPHYSLIGQPGSSGQLSFQSYPSGSCPLTFFIALYSGSEYPAFWNIQKSDSDYWSWIYPVYSSESTLEVIDALGLESNGGPFDGVSSRAADTEWAHSPAYLIGSFLYLGQGQIEGGVWGYANESVFIGFSENDPNIPATANPSAFFYYYSDWIPNEDRFAYTSLHPYFCNTYIEDAYSLAAPTAWRGNPHAANSRDGYWKTGVMLANGLFRAVRAYPFKRVIDMMPIRTKKLSPYLNCQITTAEGMIQCPLNLITSGDPYGNFTNAVGIYVAQPDKYSIIRLAIGTSGPLIYHDFSYTRFDPNDYGSFKIFSSAFGNLDNINPSVSPCNECAEVVGGCLPFPTYDAIQCDPRLSAQGNEVFMSTFIKAYTNLDGITGNVYAVPLSTDPLVFTFDAYAKYKRTYNFSQSNIPMNPGPYPPGPINCQIILGIANGSHLSFCGNDLPVLEKHVCNVLISELT